jgi:hypothetical protein
MLAAAPTAELPAAAATAELLADVAAAAASSSGGSHGGGNGGGAAGSRKYDASGENSTSSAKTCPCTCGGGNEPYFDGW